ncbi:hypothetical protein BRARA_H01005 [Brassica rapa]|uniref:J domain-containing protein n=1 Tax=Brassica campestris TaxID=3711 RepID=A0A397Y9W2_BRACM|nr:hypothetical protein BRARA_H01005 [Brassica rapa]
MECNKEEATKAIKIAERKLSENDYNGAKRFAGKAKTLYPTLDGLEQISTMVDVYISASNKTNGSESDWYGILGVDPLADEEAVKKQYKKLALLLHPDKNRFNGAEGAFKLVLDAWSLLSDKAKRLDYDQKRKRKEAKEKKSEQKKTEKRARQEPGSCNVDGKAKEASSKKKKVSSTFWTMCTHCLTYSEHVRAHSLDKTSLCPFCHGIFVATEKFPEMVNGKPFIRFAPPRQQATFWTMCTHCSTYSEHVRAGHLDKTLPCPFCHGLFVATESFPEMVNGKPFIRFAPPRPKPQATSGSTSDAPNSTHEADMHFKKPMATGHPHSRFEDLNSTHEAQRLFSRSGRTGVR